MNTNETKIAKSIKDLKLEDFFEDEDFEIEDQIQRATAEDAAPEPTK